MEKPIDWIEIDDGNLFDGTRDQFKDCFFDNATDDQIIEWARTLGVSAKINGDEKVKLYPFANPEKTVMMNEMELFDLCYGFYKDGDNDARGRNASLGSFRSHWTKTIKTNKNVN